MEKLYAFTVFCEIIELRDAGLRLRESEWPAPLAGELRMDYFDGRNNNHRRTLRRLTLWHTGDGNTARPGVPLNDPELVDVVGGAWLFRGHVLQSRDGRIYEHEQMWLVRPRQSIKGPPLDVFDPAPYAGRLPEPGPGTSVIAGSPRATGGSAR